MITKVTITPPLPINLYLLLFIFYQTYQNKIDKMFRIWEEGNLRIPIKTSFNQSVFFSRLSPLEVTLLHFENQMSFPLILKWMNYVLFFCNTSTTTCVMLIIDPFFFFYFATSPVSRLNMELSIIHPNILSNTSIFNHIIFTLDCSIS